MLMTIRTCSRSAACAEEIPATSAVASEKVLIEWDIERSFLDKRGTPTDAMPLLRSRIGERHPNKSICCEFPPASAAAPMLHRKWLAVSLRPHHAV
jgi:hypothetical protein